MDKCDKNEKTRISQELVYILAIIIMSFGVALMEKANFGVSMVVAPAYILSMRFSFLTFGQAEYCVQLFLVVLMCIVLKKFKLSYLFAFVTTIIYGAVLDAFIYILGFLPSDSVALRIVYCVAGAVITSLSVAMFFKTYISPCAYDQFVKVISLKKHLNSGHFKLGYDITSLLVSVVMTLSFFGKIQGIGIATVVCAFVNGWIIGFFGKVLDKHFEFYAKSKFEKYFAL